MALTVAVEVGEQPRWITQDVGMWLGQRAYIEIADGAAADYNGAQTRMLDGHGFVAIDEVRMSDGPPPRETGPAVPPPIRLDHLAADLRTSDSALARRLETALAEYRTIEAEIPEPTLALAIADGTGENERVLIRGNHHNPGELVPRRFLEVLGGLDQATPAGGERPPRAGPAHGRSPRQPAAGSRDGEPDLEAPFR